MTGWSWRVLLLSALLLSGCAGKGTADLEAYVAELQAKKTARIEPLPPVRTFKPYTYSAQGLRDPFAPPAQEQAPEVLAKITRKKNGLRPDTTRPREELEAFPLDGLRMVGTLERGGTTYGVVLAPQGTVYRVKVGDHMGKNFGHIDQITEQGILLTEIVPDGLDGYRKRKAKLVLKE